MARRKQQSREDPTEQISAGALRKIASGNHVHVAEIHGEGQTLGLRPWARRDSTEWDAAVPGMPPDPR